MFNRLNVLLSEEQIKNYRAHVLHKLGNITDRLKDRSVIHRPLNKFERTTYLTELSEVGSILKIQLIHLRGILALLEEGDSSLFENMAEEHLHKSNVCKAIKDLTTLHNEFLSMAEIIREKLKDQEIYKPQSRKDRENKVSGNYSRYKQDPTEEVNEMLRLVRKGNTFTCLIEQRDGISFKDYRPVTIDPPTTLLETTVQQVDFSKGVHGFWISVGGSPKNPFDCYDLFVKNHRSYGQSGYRVTNARNIIKICDNILKSHKDALLNACNIKATSGGDRKLIKEYCRAILKLSAQTGWKNVRVFFDVIKQFERAYYLVRHVDGGDDRWGNRSDPATVLRNISEVGYVNFTVDGTVSFVRHDK